MLSKLRPAVNRKPDAAFSWPALQDWWERAGRLCRGDFGHEGLGLRDKFLLARIAAEIEDEIGCAGGLLGGEPRPGSRRILEPQAAPHDDIDTVGAAGAAKPFLQLANHRLELVGGEHRMPSGAEFHHAAQRGAAVAADPDRREGRARGKDEGRK